MNKNSSEEKYFKNQTHLNILSIYKMFPLFCLFHELYVLINCTVIIIFIETIFIENIQNLIKVVYHVTLIVTVLAQYIDFNL